MKTYSLLIVDDEQTNCENLADILEMFGHDVVWTCDPQAALKLVEESPRGRFDIALIDLKMPEMNGAELLRRIRETNPFLQAVLISAYIDTDEIDEGAKELFEVILSKPVDVDALMESIKHIVPVVLCVDDDQDYCDVLTEIFSTSGIESFFGHSIESIQSKIDSNPYNVAVVDLRLPDGNGLAVVDLLKKSNPDIGVIVISGYSNDIGELATQTTPSKISAIFEKPVDSNELLKKIFEINHLKIRGRFENPDS